MKDLYSILVADDHPMFRRGIVDLLHREYIYRCTEAEDGEQAVHLASINDFDLILLDERMPRKHGYDAARAILQLKPESKIIAFTQYDERSLVLNFLKIGVKGFVVKNADSDVLIAALRQVRKGGTYIYSRDHGQISTVPYVADENVPTIRFSRRELQVIAMMSKGKTTEQIAEGLALNPRTVETYRYDLIKKAGLTNSVELIAYVYQNGIVG